MRMLLAVVGVTVVPVTVIAFGFVRTVGIHAGRVEASLGGVLVGVTTAIVSMGPLAFVAVRTLFGV